MLETRTRIGAEMADPAAHSRVGPPRSSMGEARRRELPKVDTPWHARIKTQMTRVAHAPRTRVARSSGVGSQRGEHGDAADRPRSNGAGAHLSSQLGRRKDAKAGRFPVPRSRPRRLALARRQSIADTVTRWLPRRWTCPRRHRPTSSQTVARGRNGEVLGTRAGATLLTTDGATHQ